MLHFYVYILLNTFISLNFLFFFCAFQDTVHEVSMHVHELTKTDGLVPIFINADTGNFQPASTITMGARGDSYYEYLVKQWIQSGKKLTV